MKVVSTIKMFTVVLISLLVTASGINAQVCEWRLSFLNYSSADPDAGGPAVGSVTFKLQIHTTGATIPNINVISTGWNWQSTRAMIPTTPGCAIVSNPANVTVSPAFLAAGFAYTTVFQCGVFAQNLGGSENFDRRAVGTLDGTGITLDATWVDVFTVTMWSLNAGPPFAGFVTINSGSGGNPFPFTTYSVSDDQANEYPVNSLTTNPPLALGGSLPVTFTNYNVKCNDKGALLTWSTASEQNSDRFEIQRSINSIDWVVIDNVTAAGNSDAQRNYQYLDLKGGAAFYRIRQVDRDGRYIYTAIKQTDCKISQFDVTLYPVPASDKITVVIKSDQAVRTDLQIVDINGRTVSKTVTQINIGNNNIILNVSNLPAGQYLLSSSDPSIIINRKFTVLR
jgi:hypothetical protein